MPTPTDATTAALWATLRALAACVPADRADLARDVLRVAAADLDDELTDPDADAAVAGVFAGVLAVLSAWGANECAEPYKAPTWQQKTKEG